ADQVQYIYIIDNSAPVLTGTLPPSMSNLDLCEAPVGPSEADVAAAYTDNCSNVVVTKTTNTVQTGECGWATQFSYTIEDECGNALDPIKILYWGSDQSAPELAPNMSLPKDNFNLTTCLDEALMGDGAGATVDEVYKLFTDNCDTKVSVYKSEPVYVGQQGCDYHYYYEFTIVDNCDNSYLFKQHFSGSDKDAPVLVGSIPLDVSDINECLSEALQGTAAGPTEANIIALYSECSGYGTVYVDKNTVTFGDDCNWIISHEYTIYDDCGNFATPVKITYSGADLDAPEFIQDCAFDPLYIYTSDGADCPADAYSSLKVGDEITAYDTWFVAGQEIFSLAGCVYDDCTAMEDLIIRVTDVTNSKDSCSNTITISFEAEDSCGNISTVPFTCRYIIVDDTNPTGTAPADVAVQCASDVPAVNIKDVIDAKDNCNTVTVTHVSDVTDDSNAPDLVITRTYRITDACDNYIEVTQTITVEDTIAPEIECPLDVSVNLTAPAIAGFTSLGTYNGKAYYLSDAAMTGPDAFADALANGGYAVTVNDAAENSKIYNWVQPIIGNSHYFIGLSDEAIEGTFVWQNGEALGYTNWYVPTGEPNNAGGNEDCVEVNFFGNDTWNDIPCGLAHRYVLEVNGTVVDYPAPVYSDNCDPTPSIDFSHASGDVFPVGDTTVTITVVDASGNDASCSFVVTVVETVPSAPAQAAADSGAGVTLDFRAYPVPFNKDVNILYNFKFDTDVTIEVYDTKGLLVLRKEVKGYSKGSDMTLPLNLNGADQLYYVKLITNRGTVIKKIVSSNVNKR
ncbi:MAG: HYR domain-containing protein, partial [Chlorobi bacterium]|nr:HYR domain-containing protein [Chlorobiota bacterium]